MAPSRPSAKKTKKTAPRTARAPVVAMPSPTVTIEQALAELPQCVKDWLGPAPALGETLYWSGMYLGTIKQFARAQQFMESAVEACRAGDDAIGETMAAIELAWQEYNETAFGPAADDDAALANRYHTLFADEAALIEQLPEGSDIGEAQARLAHYRGLAAYRKGDYALGVQQFKKGLAASLNGGLEEARLRDSLAVHYERMGDFHLAQQHLRRSLQIKKRRGLLWEEAITSQILGRLFLIQENYRQSRHYTERSLALSLMLEDRRRVESLYNTLIKLAVYTKKLPRATQLISDVDRFHAHLVEGGDIVAFTSMCVTKDKKKGRQRSIQPSSEACGRMMLQSKEYGVTQFYRARVWVLEDNMADAETLLQESIIPAFKKHRARKDLAKAYRLLACIYATQGNYQQTVETMGQALALFRELNLVDEQAKTHYELGQAFAELGEQPLAMESLMEALRIAEQNGLRFMIHHIQEDIHELDASRWEEIVNQRVRHQPVFERERTLLDALTHLSKQRELPKQAVEEDDNDAVSMASALAESPNAQTRSLISLLRVGQAISGEPNVDKLLDVVTEETKQALSCDRCTVFLYDEGANELWSRVATGVSEGTGDTNGGEHQEIRFPAHLGLAGYVCKTGEVLNIKNPYDDPRFNRDVDKKTGYVTENLLCMPMKNRDGHTIGVFQVLNKAGGPFIRADEDLLMAIASQASVSLENAQRAKDQKAAFVSFIKTLSSAIDKRDPITAGHSERVAHYSGIIGEELKLPKDEAEALDVAALLHDIGKIGVREAVLTKEGRLTLEEYRHIQEHAEFTYDILKNIHFERHLRNVPEIAASHHERMDGTGYFRGLEGENIPFLGRVLALSDVFDAITSRRHYRDRMPFDRVLKILRRDEGSHFDPTVVDAFFNIPLHKLARLLLMEQREDGQVNTRVEDLMIDQVSKSLNVTINEYYHLLEKPELSQGESIIHTNFSTIYLRGNLDLQLD